MPQPLQQQAKQNGAALLTNPTQWFSRPSISPLQPHLKLAPCADELEPLMDRHAAAGCADATVAVRASCHCFLAEISQVRQHSVLDCTDAAGRAITVELDVSPSPASQEAWQLVNSELSAGRTLASINACRLSSGRVSVRPELSAVLPLDMGHVTRLCDVIACCSVRLCWQCRRRRRGAPLLRCARCRYARYCGPACQAEDWRRHQLECGQAVRTVARLVCFNYAGPEPPFNPFYAFAPDTAAANR